MLSKEYEEIAAWLKSVIHTAVFWVEVSGNVTLHSGCETQNESYVIQMGFELDTCCQIHRVTVTCTLAVTLVHLKHCESQENHQDGGECQRSTQEIHQNQRASVTWRERQTSIHITGILVYFFYVDLKH